MSISWISAHLLGYSPVKRSAALAAKVATVASSGLSTCFRLEVERLETGGWVFVWGSSKFNDDPAGVGLADGQGVAHQKPRSSTSLAIVFCF